MSRVQNCVSVSSNADVFLLFFFDCRIPVSQVNRIILRVSAVWKEGARNRHTIIGIRPNVSNTRQMKVANLRKMSVSSFRRRSEKQGVEKRLET